MTQNQRQFYVACLTGDINLINSMIKSGIKIFDAGLVSSMTENNYNIALLMINYGSNSRYVKACGVRFQEKLNLLNLYIEDFRRIIMKINMPEDINRKVLKFLNI